MKIKTVNIPIPEVGDEILIKVERVKTKIAGFQKKQIGAVIYDFANLEKATDCHVPIYSLTWDEHENCWVYEGFL